MEEGRVPVDKIIEENRMVQASIRKGREVTRMPEKAVGAGAKVSAPKKERTPKTTLIDLPVGTVDGSQKLVEKNSDGSVQLWQGKIGFGVVRIVKNKYQVIVPCRTPEEAAREVFSKTN